MIVIFFHLWLKLLSSAPKILLCRKTLVGEMGRVEVNSRVKTLLHFKTMHFKNLM